ncbi:MAG: glutathione S-transferase family protein [Pseudomonadota bacterium]|nr:glutathione S-transferase family protein [Pseudomonadota bacterium]
MSQLSSPVEIYWISGSPFAWRVLLTAEVKDIPYEGKLLEASKGGLKTPEFLVINPLGRVPAIRDGNFTLHESLAIMVYLDRKHPNPPLFGRTAEEAGRIFQCISEFSSDFGPSNQRLGRSIFFGPPLGADEAKEAREKIHLSLARLEGYAESSVWMAGPDLTAADIVAYPGLNSCCGPRSAPKQLHWSWGLMTSRHAFPASRPGCNGSSSSQVTRRPIRRIGGMHSGGFVWRAAASARGNCNAAHNLH